VNYSNLLEFGGEQDQLEVAEGAYSLAGVCKDLGRLDEAEKLLKSCLEVYEALLVPVHGKIAGCLDSLANVRTKHA
jgi:7-keto-8-aminopelargonate synthetase-like enzyme